VAVAGPQKHHHEVSLHTHNVVPSDERPRPDLWQSPPSAPRKFRSWYVKFVNSDAYESYFWSAVVLISLTCTVNILWYLTMLIK